MSPQSATACLQIISKPLMVAWCDAVATKFQSLTPQGLASTIWALTTTGWKSKALMDQLMAATRSRLQEFQPQQLSLLLVSQVLLVLQQCKVSFMRLQSTV
jgi:hypothetical protein